jgi:hypothetical protein
MTVEDQNTAQCCTNPMLKLRIQSMLRHPNAFTPYANHYSIYATPCNATLYPHPKNSNALQQYSSKRPRPNATGTQTPGNAPTRKCKKCSLAR